MSSAESLACGADPEVLLAQVAEGRGQQRDSHQGRCPHCQVTLVEYARLWAPFEALAATEVRAPAGLLDHALATVREHTGPAGYGRVSNDDGSFLVAARAVVTVAGHAARTSSGVRMALGALGELTHPDPDFDRAARAAAVGAGVSGQSVAVEVNVAAEYGHDLRRLAEHLRERVAAEVRAETGLEVVVVDVSITDVFARPDVENPPRSPSGTPEPSRWVGPQGSEAPAGGPAAAPGAS